MQTGHSGLGLWMTHLIIAERGGFIRVTSEEGEGATFDLYLPRTEAAGYISRPPSAAKAAPKVILTIGQERSRAYRAIRYSLQTKSADFESVPSWDEAREVLTQRDDIRAVVIDLPETDKSAAEIVAEIRAVKAHLPVVVVSSADINMLDDDETCHVHVPFTPMILMEKLQSITKDTE